MKLKTNPMIFVRFAAAAAVPFLCIALARSVFGYDAMDRSGWHTTRDGSPCYLSYEGEPLLGWQDIEGETYYFSPELQGAMATGWITVEEGTFYLTKEGLKTTGWADIQEDRYYFEDTGVMQTGWLDLPEGRYYLDENGAMESGWVDLPEGRFFLSEEGLMQTGWMETPTGLCYLSESGAVTSGWVETDKGRSYIDADGSVHTGWLEDGGRTYFLGEDGTARTGWMDVDDDRYYFLDNGSMAVGCVEIDGAARYFTSQGKYFVLVNPWNKVPEDYEADLVWYDGFQVDASCVDALDAMVTACEAAGYPCEMTSAYRGISYQTTLFERKVNKLLAAGYTRAAAEAETSRSIAIPSTSEHHLGLAVDLKNTFSTYAWLAQNGWRYGFIQRYPEGTTSLTGIYYEPWHYRYVGKELAAELHDLGLCVEAYMDMLTENQT